MPQPSASPRSAAAPLRESGAEPPRFQIEIHDRQQLEIELTYPLRRERPSGYSVELLLFVPRNVGVSSQNYPSDSFYNDLIAYLRMDSKPLTLSELADISCEQSPLHQLNHSLSQLEQDIYARPRRPIITLVKLFGHAFRESVRSAELLLREQIKQLASTRGELRREGGERLLRDLDALGRNGRQALLHLRKMRRRFEPVAGARPQVVKDTFEFIDEYVSSYLVERLAQLAQRLQGQSALHDGSCLVARALQVIDLHAQEVARGRRREGFAYPDPRDQRAAEFFTYRRGLIKKAMQQAFYLETRTLRRDPYLRNAIAMFAAGLAAIWWLAAQVPGTLGDLSESTRFWVLASAVVAYMLKDRIKEMTREYLGKRLRRYDHDNAIIGESMIPLGLRGVEGRVRERVRWTSPAALPEGTIRLRSHPRTVAGTDISTEEVLHYVRTLKLGPREREVLPPGFALRDILRLNLRHFMTRLDEPLDKVSYYDIRLRRFLRVLTPKVYHLNTLLKVTGEAGEELLLSRHRVVLNKERILRIEQVALRRRGEATSPC